MTPAEAPNLYTSAAYLEVARRTYCDGRPSRTMDFALDGRRFRLLATRSWGSGLRWRPGPMPPFLDMHEPVSNGAGSAEPLSLRYLTKVCHGMVESDAFREQNLAARYMAAPTVQWERFGSWDEYLAFLRGRSSLVKDDQRRMRRLGETLGPVVFQVDDASDDVFPKVFAWKSVQMTETLGFDLFADPRHRQFFVEMRRDGLLRVSTLRAEGRLLAAWFGAIHQGRWYGWVFAHDPDPALRKLSVGRLLLYRMLEESQAQGHRELDFSIGDEPYKWFFSTHARMIAPVGTPPLRLKVRRALVAAVKSQPWLEAKVRAMRRGAGPASGA